MFDFSEEDKWSSNDQLIVKAVCKKCNEEHLLFDSGKHGWNSFVCGDDFLNRDKPYDKYSCSDGGEEIHNVITRICSQEKEDFIEECLLNDDSFSLEDWVDAFEWINISLECEKCGLICKE